MTTPWFTAAARGRRWRPAKWQGWTVLFSYIVILAKAFLYFDAHAPSASATLLIFAPFFVLCTFILALIVTLTIEIPRAPARRRVRRPAKRP